MDNTIIHKADYVWDGLNDKALPEGAVLVEGSRIRAVGPSREIATASHAAVFEWPGATLLPGLIDSHTHLSMDGSLENYLDRMTDSVPVLTLRATAMMRKDLMAGVTTCRCLGDREFLDVACREAVERGEVMGPRLLVATRGIRAPEGHGFVGYPFKGAEEIKNAVHENIARGANLIKIYITGTLKGTGSLPAYLTREEIKLVIDESHNAGIPVAAHCVGGEGLDWAIEFGLDTIEHAYQITPEQVARLARSNTSLVLTPGAVLAEERVKRLPKSLIQGHLLEREQMFTSMALAVDAHIGFGVGTDGTHGDLARDIQYLSELGATHFKALKAATSDGAKVCGIGRETGSLEKGKYADIIAVEGNPLEQLAALKKVIAVVSKGKLVKSKQDDK